MVQKKTTYIIGILALVGILLAWLVMAAAGDDIFIETQLNGTNYSGGTALTFVNVSFNNATDIVTTGQPINISTIYVNMTLGTGKLFRVANNSFATCVIPTAAAINASCIGNYNLSALENGTLLSDGVYTLVAALTNSSGLGVNMSKPTMFFRIDNTEPASGIFQVLTSGNNHSHKSLGNANMTLNISVADFNNPANNGSSNISSVTFFFINKTGSLAGNATVKASREGSTGSYWSTSVDTRGILDGIYNLTVLVNDTAGNFNRTMNATTYAAANSYLKQIIIDNTPPSVTHSCTPNPVEQGDVLTCTCSGSDSFAGVNSTSFTTNPSTSSSGPGQTTTCTVTDRAGNSATNTFTYTVNGGSSNNGGGSSGGGSGGGSGGTTGGSSGGSTGGGAGLPPNESSGTSGTGSNTGSGAGASGLFGVSLMAWIIGIIIVVGLIIAIVFYTKKNKAM